MVTPPQGPGQGLGTSTPQPYSASHCHERCIAGVMLLTVGVASLVRGSRKDKILPTDKIRIGHVMFPFYARFNSEHNVYALDLPTTAFLGGRVPVDNYFHQPPRGSFSSMGETGYFSDLVCDHCHAHFRRREHLERHTRRHFELRPFRCQWCSKSFSRK